MHIGGFTALTSYGVTNILEFQNKNFMQKQTLELVEWNATPTTFHESICKKESFIHGFTNSRQGG